MRRALICPKSEPPSTQPYSDKGTVIWLHLFALGTYPVVSDNRVHLRMYFHEDHKHQVLTERPFVVRSDGIKDVMYPTSLVILTRLGESTGSIGMRGCPRLLRT